MERVAIYSTYCGSKKNKTFNSSPVDRRYPHFFLSNSPDVLKEASRAGWTPLYLDFEISDDPVVSAFQAKKAKAVPHLIEPLPKYHYLFYKDDKINLDTNRMEEFISVLEKDNAALALCPHPFLSKNVLFEFGEAMLQPRYRVQRAQTVNYITEELNSGLRLECQLYTTSAILRDMKHPDTQRINDLWYDHIQRCGIECQISFDFIAQRFQSIALLPLDINPVEKAETSRNWFNKLKIG